MGFLKKNKKKKPLRSVSHGGAGVSSARPQQTEAEAPCIAHCPSGTDIRGWLTIIAQREKTKLSEGEAFEQAWKTLVDTNPFPSIMGRVCPHPCEDACNRTAKDGAVSINACERFIGDWALENKLALPVLDSEKKPESIGVIGAGPAGLSFAYQMARRGYPVTVYEKYPKPGGMLLYGIPVYRLPEEVLLGEIQRIADLGVEIKCDTEVGKDITVEELRGAHSAIYVGIGAHSSRPLRIKGEEGDGVWGGIDYLNLVNRGEKVDVGQKVGIIGGGDTAIDAARMARRAGADVTIIYRRTRKEMPAIESEIEDALKEGVKIEYLLAPVEVKRDGDNKVTALLVQKMELGEPDSSGRRRPVPIEGSEYEIPLDSLIAAISQAPDWGAMDEIKPASGWPEPHPQFEMGDDLWTGGDVVNLGIATTAIGHGRQAAEFVHAKLRGDDPPHQRDRPDIGPDMLKLDFYEAAERAPRAHRPVEEWLSKPDDEIDQGITHEGFVAEAARCFSCGFCFGCERCWMYCTPSCFSKVEEPRPGLYYTVKLDTCDGCKKCAEECPCGFLVMV